MSTVSPVQGHISSVRTLATSMAFQTTNSLGSVEPYQVTNEADEPPNYLDRQLTHTKLLFSAGGRAQMKCWRIHSDCDNDAKIQHVPDDAACHAKQPGAAGLHARGATNNTDSCKRPGAAGLHSASCAINTSDSCKRTAARIGVWYESLGSHMLQWKGHRHCKPWKTEQYDSSPETRYMSLTAFNLFEVTATSHHTHLHIIAAACSDGYIRYQPLLC